MEQWWRFANSLKLRMALHLTKVDPKAAKEWAEEAVASGVIERTDQEVGLFTFGVGFQHPLINIVTWNDTKLQRIVRESPYESRPSLHSLSVLKTPTRFPMWVMLPVLQLSSDRGAVHVSSVCVRVLLPVSDSRLVPTSTMRSVLLQDSARRQLPPPLYLMKLSEVCFLRAEGALRGWNMGGTAQQFYEEGIRYAGLEDRDTHSNNDYAELVDAYMQREAPVDYTYVDPTGNTPDVPSVTKDWCEVERGLSTRRQSLR